MSAALAYRPDRSDTALVFQLKDGTYNTDTLIEFLTDLHDQLNGEKIIVIWDGLPSHRSRAMKAWIVRQRSWLRVEQLPGYAPDLNPVELIWGNIKGTELANLCPDNIDEAADAADTGLMRVGTNTQLCFSFLDHTGLSL
jgi:transposase